MSSDVLGEDRGVEAPIEILADRPRHLERDGVLFGQHDGVGDHPALRREPGAVAAVTGGERDHVVGQQALQPGGAIGAGDPDDAAVGARDQGRAAW